MWARACCRRLERRRPGGSARCAASPTTSSQVVADIRERTRNVFAVNLRVPIAGQHDAAVPAHADRREGISYGSDASGVTGAWLTTYMVEPGTPPGVIGD
jgi:hypothetical protein